jgi:two-component system, cell cycle response regulator
MQESYVAIVDDDPVSRKLIFRILQKEGILVKPFSNAISFLEEIVNNSVEYCAIISDYYMPLMNGLELLRKIRHKKGFETIPFIVMTADQSGTVLSRIFEEEATDYLVKPFLREELLARLKSHIRVSDLNKQLQIKMDELKILNKELEFLAHSDYLTGLPNRRSFFEKFEWVLKQNIELGLPLGLIMLDVDYFKEVNDTFGHQTGDKALVELAKIFSQVIGPKDICARIGGEEFAILLWESGIKEAIVKAEIIRRRVEKEVRIELNLKRNITISLGIVCLESDLFQTTDQMFSAADNQLYLAKNKGRNRYSAYMN